MEEGPPPPYIQLWILKSIISEYMMYKSNIFSKIIYFCLFLFLYAFPIQA